MRRIISVIVAFLSIAAGVAKLMKVPQETTFFDSLGIDLRFMLILGIFQVAAGIFIFMPRARRMAAILTAIAFSFSTIMIFMTGQIGFGLFSILPVVLALYLAALFHTAKRAEST